LKLLGLGANPGSFDFAYFLVSSLYRWSTAFFTIFGQCRFFLFFNTCQYKLSPLHTTGCIAIFPKNLKPLRDSNSGLLFLRRMLVNCTIPPELVVHSSLQTQPNYVECEM
jgi:hypothetical protein